MPDLYGRDWRHSLVDGITLKEPASDVLPAHKRRTVGVVVTTTRDQAGRLMSFATPSPVSLALDIAERAAATANLLRVQIKEVPTPSTLGDDFFVSHESVPALFDYFQHCMITVTFSYQALEAFCNATIKRHLVHPYPYKTKQGVDLLDADELERRASTDEKLAVILPHILGVSSPKGRAIWGKYKSLKRARDSTIHIKSVDQQKLIGQESDLDKESLFYRFLSESAESWPKWAAELLAHYRAKVVNFWWYDVVLERYGFTATKMNKT